MKPLRDPAIPWLIVFPMLGFAAGYGRWETWWGGIVGAAIMLAFCGAVMFIGMVLLRDGKGPPEVVRVEPLEWFHVHGKPCAAIANPVECSDWKHLKVVSINCRQYRVLGVERLAHAPPWRKGERIGLMLQEIVG